MTAVSWQAVTGWFVYKKRRRKKLIMEEVIDISYWHLGIGMLLMLFPLYYFWRLKTGLLKSAVISTVRMTVQLLLIGVYLRFLFQLDNIFVNLLWTVVMAIVASYTAVKRTSLKTSVLLMPVFVGLLVTVLVVSAYFLGLVMQVDNVLSVTS